MKYMMPYTLPIAERGEGIRDEERRPTAYYKYVEVFTMKYMMPYTLNQQNAEKVSETKREGRRRTTATSRPSR